MLKACYFFIIIQQQQKKYFCVITNSKKEVYSNVCTVSVKAKGDFVLDINATSHIWAIEIPFITNNSFTCILQVYSNRWIDIDNRTLPAQTTSGSYTYSGITNTGVQYKAVISANGTQYNSNIAISHA